MEDTLRCHAKRNTGRLMMAGFHSAGSVFRERAWRMLARCHAGILHENRAISNVNRNTCAFPVMTSQMRLSPSFPGRKADSHVFETSCQLTDKKNKRGTQCMFSSNISTEMSVFRSILKHLRVLYPSFAVFIFPPSSFQSAFFQMNHSRTCWACETISAPLWTNKSLLHFHIPSASPPLILLVLFSSFF